MYPVLWSVRLKPYSFLPNAACQAKNLSGPCVVISDAVLQAILKLIINCGLAGVE